MHLTAAAYRMWRDAVVRAAAEILPWACFMTRPLLLGPHGRSQTRVGQCSRIDPVALGSWSNSTPNPYQSATAVKQRISAITGLTHSLGVVGSIAKIPGPPLFTKSGSITY